MKQIDARSYLAACGDDAFDIGGNAWAVNYDDTAILGGHEVSLQVAVFLDDNKLCVICTRQQETTSMYEMEKSELFQADLKAWLAGKGLHVDQMSMSGDIDGEDDFTQYDVPLA